ncbi:MAG TPA: phosphatidate cytidylyltransferase, partial [Candidatus Wujingus californicus]|uniref:phosphatidate cytidylyltransferase n=1 Tax=Candidatus Wujingus californicus TaxID=3367618 RepID=UPI00402803FC
MNTLQTRITLGVIMFAAFFGVLAVDAIFKTDIGFGCLAIIVCGVGLHEFYNIATKNGFSPFRISGICIGIWLFISYWLTVRKDSDVIQHFFRHETVIVSIFWLFLIQAFARSTKDAIKNISVTLFGVLYVSFLLSYAIALRHLTYGTSVLVMVLLVSKFGDIGGYLLGKKFGKHKLAKVISPNKTIEGACFSLSFSVLIAVIFNSIPQTRVISIPWAILFGLIVGFSAMMGDLAES